jgi:hypothetical protein
MTKGKNYQKNHQKAGASGAQGDVEEDMFEDTSTGGSTENSPAKKKARGEPEPPPDLGEDDLKLADYITKKVTGNITDLISLSIQAALAPIVSVANEAKEKSKEAIAVAKEARAEQKKMSEELSALRGQVTIQGKQIEELQGKSFGTVKMLGQGFGPAAGAECSTLFEDTVQPTSTPADRLRRLFDVFTEKSHAARTTRTFVLGRKKGETPATLAAVKIVMECYFPDVYCVVTKTDAAKAAKVYVPKPEDAQKLRRAIDSTWAALGSEGWWIKEDQPEEFAKIETRAREFFGEAKKARPEYKKTIGYVTIKYGMASKGGKELLPLFLLPPKATNTWPKLFSMIVNRIDSFSGSELLGLYAEDDDDFYLKWIEAAGLTKLDDDVRAIRAV